MNVPPKLPAQIRPGHSKLAQEPRPAAIRLTERFARLIAMTGPISIAQFMAESNAFYYDRRDPLGVAGDFITAPEISQMFGELIGVWLVDIWQRSPAAAGGAVHYVELGPGRGTLARDALATMRRFGLAPTIHLVEASTALRAAQRDTLTGIDGLGDVIWHDTMDSLPVDGPILLVANEFLDALPVRQLVRTAKGWRERMVGLSEPAGDDETPRLVPISGDRPMDAALPDPLPDAYAEAPEGTIIETSPAAATIVGEIAARLARQGGAALVIDYGRTEAATGSSLQALHAHRRVDPFAMPGAADLTAHVDFSVLPDIARSVGARWLGTVEQGDFLLSLGIAARAQALIAARPATRDAVLADLTRLVAPEAMGSLFKVMGLAAPDWPDGAGFEALPQEP